MSDQTSGSGGPSGRSWWLVAVAWGIVGIPLAWGIYRTLLTAAKIF